MAQQEFIGFNSVGNLGIILSRHNPRSIFLVTGKSSYEKSGAKEIMDRELKRYKVLHFRDFEAGPKLPDIEKGLGIFKENNCDFVICIGGGSAIDMGKSINILASNAENPFDYIRKTKKIRRKGCCLAAMPTTSGSGSEATKFAVVYHDKTKYSLENEYMLPDYAIIDPQFTMNLPKSITASSGMDALCQATESYWSVNSTRASKDFAKEALKLILKNISNAVNNPSIQAREAMAMAAHLAGKAINISKTTACHALSYPMTSHFNVPHGQAVALTLASMLEYNSEATEKDALDKRGADYVKETIRQIAGMMGSGSIEESKNKIREIMEGIGLETKLSRLGIRTQRDIQLILRNGFSSDRVKNNPRKLTKEALKKLLEEIR